MPEGYPPTNWARAVIAPSAQPYTRKPLVLKTQLLNCWPSVWSSRSISLSTFHSESNQDEPGNLVVVVACRSTAVFDHQSIW